MKIQILGPGPDRFGLQAIGDYLRSVLRRVKSGGTVKITVAYAQDAGWSFLQPMLSKILKERNTIVECILGIDDQGTSQRVVESAVQLLGVPHVFLFHNPADATFHLKFFLIQPNHNEGIVIVGSSNLTESGLLSNFELNIAFEFDLSKKAGHHYFNQFQNLFEQIKNAPSSLSASRNLIQQLCQSQAFTGSIVSQSTRSLENIRQGIQHLFPKTSQKKRPRRTKLILSPQRAKRERSFIMTLAYNDVSGRRSEPYILIPLVARDYLPHFWGWPESFIQGRKYRERRFNIEGYISGRRCPEFNRRLYYVPERSEFRLVCRSVYQLGSSHAGSILRLQWKRENLCQFTIVSPEDPTYVRLIKKCQSLFQGKKWGYG